MNGSATQQPTAVNPNKALWEKGDFSLIAETMRESGAALVNQLNVGPGLQVLELGCGDGNTAIPAARLGATVQGVDISSKLVAAANKRIQQEGLSNISVREGDAANLEEIANNSFDLVISIFGAMFSPKPFEVAKEMVRVTRRGGHIIMGNWIPNDPTMVAQLLKISSVYTPPPPEGFISPMLWGVESHVIERFGNAGIAPENISFLKDEFTFRAPYAPSVFVERFRDYYGPTMNAFEAAEKAGKAAELQHELEELFVRENRSGNPDTTCIPAAFLRVTVTK
ncbi:MAG: class I SAM-dependent methyltransferase [Flavisolibacter sp.]